MLKKGDPVTTDENKENLMEMVLKLARLGEGKTDPNPQVGALIINKGKIQGTGYHQEYGENHAEIEALKSAGKNTEGGTLYVNLEPCCHHGKTPPCTDAIIKAGIKKVIIATSDPDPRVRGRGIKILRKNGLEVETGILEEKARELNENFFRFAARKRPFVLLKSAVTLDGKIATKTGNSRWITGEEARQEVHRLRNRYEAIMVGSETVLNDDPQLTTRLVKGENPLRLIPDSRGKIPPSVRIFNLPDPQNTLIFTTNQISKSREKEYLEKKATVVKLPQKQKKVDLQALMEWLYQQKVRSILLEGGGTLNWAMLENGLVDKVVMHISPKIIGGKNAPGPIGGTGLDQMDSALGLKDIRIEKLGEDIAITGYIQKE